MKGGEAGCFLLKGIWECTLPVGGRGGGEVRASHIQRSGCQGEDTKDSVVVGRFQGGGGGRVARQNHVAAVRGQV